MQVKRIAIAAEDPVKARELAKWLAKELAGQGTTVGTLDLTKALDGGPNPAADIEALGPDIAEIHIGLLEWVRRHYDDRADFNNEHEYTQAVLKRYIHFWPYGMIFMLADIPRVKDIAKYLKNNGNETAILPMVPVAINGPAVLRKVQFVGRGICLRCSEETDLYAGYCTACREKKRKERA